MKRGRYGRTYKGTSVFAATTTRYDGQELHHLVDLMGGGEGKGYQRQEFIRMDITKDTKKLRVTRDISRKTRVWAGDQRLLRRCKKFTSGCNGIGWLVWLGTKRRRPSTPCFLWVKLACGQIYRYLDQGKIGMYF